ncbi:MAG: PDZ domain-containing protein, partial [Pyrinomonadaceae bacterium]
NEKIIAGISNPAEQPKEIKSAEGDTKFVAGKSQKRFPIVTRKGNVNDDFKGSRDFGLTSSNINILPKGLGSNKKIEPPIATDNANSLKVEQVLSELGMEIVSENGNRKVKSITQNGTAERSGIMIGDVIESIDGKKLSNEPIRGKTIGIKKINVMRNGAKKEISLHY